MHRIRRVLRTRFIIYTYIIVVLLMMITIYNSYCRVSDGVGGKAVSRRAKGIDAAAVVSEVENVE